MNNLYKTSIRELINEEMELIGGGTGGQTGPTQGGVWDGGTGNGGCITVLDLGAE